MARPGPETAPGPEAGAAAGRCLGRYRLLYVLGTGSAGQVYAARDEVLGRRVAIKVLDERHAGDEACRVRLVREAQAIARLNHPGVVTVHDIGTAAGQLYMAMELVDGQTLLSWLAEPRSWRAVVEVFCRAGRGLAAAHRAGLVHRDFKPANVLLAGDGRVCVADFGIVSTPDGLDGGGNSFARAGRVLTAPGTVVGTPAYMAPEQLLGEPADARSDQYAFCVALYEALYRERPWASGRHTVAELAVAKLRGPVVRPRRPRVPRWLHRVLIRGLAGKPAERWTSMDALLRALERGQRTAARWRWSAAVLVTGGLALAGVAALHRDDAAVRACQAGAGRLATQWSGARTAVKAAFTRVGLRYASEAERRVAARMEGYASAWAAAYRSSCVATHEQHLQSRALLERRLACLEGRASHFSALTGVLASADRQAVLGAVRAADALPPIAGCADLSGLLRGIEPPADRNTAEQVDRIRQMLALGTTMRDAGQEAAALQVVEKARQRSLQLAYPPVQAEALRLAGALYYDRGDQRRARELLREAALLAEASGHDEIKARALLERSHITGEPEETLRQAEAAVRRAGRDELWPLLAQARAARHWDRGEVRAARSEFERAHALWRRHGRGPAREARFLNNVAAALGREGRNADALAAYQRALGVLVQTVGADHPDTGFVLYNTAGIHLTLGQLRQGEAELRRAAQLSQPLGPRHRQVALVRLALGELLVETGRPDEAEAHLAMAARLWSELGLAQPWRPLLGLAAWREARGELSEARALYQEALIAVVAGRGTEHPEYAVVLGRAGRAALRAGRLVTAERQLGRALELLGSLRPLERAELLAAHAGLLRVRGRTEQALQQYQAALDELGAVASQHPRIASYSLELGELLVRAGAFDRARPLLEAAHRAADRGGVGPGTRAQAALALGRLLARDPQTRQRGRQLVAQAIDLLAPRDGTAAARERALDGGPHRSPGAVRQPIATGR